MREILSLLTIVVVGFFLVTAWRSDGANAECGSASMAHIMTQEPVKAQLRAPSTAKFPSSSADGVDVSRSGECDFLVRAYVEAENGFGGAVRSTYLADVTHHPDNGTWSVTNVRLASN